MKTVFVFLSTLLSIVFCTAHADTFGLLSRVEQAQNILKKHPKNAGCGDKSLPCRNEKQFKEANVVLAISCPNDKGQVRLVRLLSSEDNSDDYQFERGAPNGVNTRFSVIAPSGCTVLAIRRAVRAPRVGFREVVYTPYAHELDTESVRAQGMKHIVRVIDRARDALLKKRVASHAFDGQLVAHTVPTWVAVRLALIEHIDPVRAGCEPIERLMNEVAVIIATNGEHAYRYSVSPANARGLFQFIPNTYDLIREKYVSAKLATDFIAGMQDQINSAQATLLLFDTDTEALSVSKRNMLAQNRVYQMEYLATAYNSGSGRARNAMHQNGTIVFEKLLPETQWYIMKLRGVHDVLRPKNPST